MNRPLFRKVLDHIIENPHEWNQFEHHCGAAHCFAGHAEIMAGHKPYKRYTPNGADRCETRARKALEISLIEGLWLFYCDRTIVEFEAFYEQNGIPK